MTQSFRYKEKPLAYWLVQLLSEDTQVHATAALAIDEMLGMDQEPFSEAVRMIVRNEDTAPYGMTSAEFVNRLLSMHIFFSDTRLRDIQSEMHESEALVDAWLAKHGDAPEKLHKLMRRLCVQKARKQREQPFDFMPGVCVSIITSALGEEFLPACELLRWMLRNEQHRPTATGIIGRMGRAGETFFQDYLDMARDDSCALHNYSHQIGEMIRHSSEKIEQLSRLVEQPDPQRSLFAVAALGSCGPEAETRVPGIEEELLRLSRESFEKLYGENTIPISDRKRRNETARMFSHSTTSLGLVATSEKALQHFLRLLDAKVPNMPLSGSPGTESNEYDWELTVAPLQLVRGTLILTLKHFASFPELVVPHLISLLTEFEEFDCDRSPFSSVLDALALYAQYDGDEAKRESQRYDYNADEREYLFSNRFESHFAALPEILGTLLWRQFDSSEGEQEPLLNDEIVATLGRFGRVSRTQLSLLEDAKTQLVKRYGKKCFKYSQDEPEPVLIAAIRRIRSDLTQ